MRTTSFPARIDARGKIAIPKIAMNDILGVEHGDVVQVTLEVPEDIDLKKSKKEKSRVRRLQATQP